MTDHNTSRSELDQRLRQLERTAKAAREAPFERSALQHGDFDDLAPARPFVWILVAVIVAAIAMILLSGSAQAAEGDLRGIVNVAAWHSPTPRTATGPASPCPPVTGPARRSSRLAAARSSSSRPGRPA